MRRTTTKTVCLIAHVFDYTLYTKIYNLTNIIKRVTIILTDHAKKRMAERAITFKQIQETIDMPDYTIQKGKKTEAIRKYDGRKLKIVYAGKDKYKKVVSVMYT